MKLELPYIHQELDRHGNVRVYFRRRGFGRVRMREPLGSAQFMVRYEQLRAESAHGRKNCVAANGNCAHRPAPGTWRALCVAYFASPEFARLQPQTRTARRQILESTFLEPIAPDLPQIFADMPVARFGAKAVKVLRDRKADLPGAANNRVKAIRRAFAWAIEDEHPGVTRNPARDISPLHSGNGFHTWTAAEVRQFEHRHPIGSKARLALALLLLTGVRRSDVVRIGPPHETNGRLVFTQTKGRATNPVKINIPILAELRAVLNVTDTGKFTYLVTTHGQPFTHGGFGNWFRARCNEAGLPHCSAHGLRKAGSTRAAENGATAHQLMAMFGWKTLAQAELYTRAAERARLAGDGMSLIVSRKPRRGS